MVIQTMITVLYLETGTQHNKRFLIHTPEV